MTDLDMRLVRYFTVVASHLHYGRAAVELHITQPSLSRQISHLEAQVGARLLDRTRQGTRLTEAGAAFLPHALRLLRATELGIADAVAADRPTRITVGYTTGLIVTPAVRNLRHNHPDAEVHTLHLSWDEPRKALLDQRVDAAITRLPLPTGGLQVTILYDEPKVLLVPVGHRLEGKESVTLGDIADEPIPRLGNSEFDAYWRIDPRPSGQPAPDGRVVGTIEDKLEYIAAGQAVAIVPAALYANGIRLDLTSIPLRDVAPGHVVLATRTGDHRRLVTAFRASARKCLRGRPQTK